MEVINTKEEFSTFVDSVKNEAGYKQPLGFGICKVDLSRVNPDEDLTANFLVSNWNENNGSAAVFQKVVQNLPSNILHQSENELVVNIDLEFTNSALALFNPFREEATGDNHLNVQAMNILNGIMNHQDFEGFKEENGIAYRLIMIYEDTVVETVTGAYLKLDALSKSKVKLRSLNLNGVFGILKRLAWVGNTPFELEWLKANEMQLKAVNRYPAIESVDKFPRYLHHIIPDENIRILDDSKVRYGAQLAKGTVIMPGASYVNFNAGTEGPSMVEGRISSSAIVGAGSDVGGGASILGVLSGTDGDPITIGKNCLLGANSVTGIPLGDGCIVDAGIAILSKTPVHVTDTQLTKIQEANPDSDIGRKSVTDDGFYAFEFSGLNGLHFRQNATTGQMVVFRSTREVKLNEDLH